MASAESLETIQAIADAEMGQVPLPDDVFVSNEGEPQDEPYCSGALPSVYYSGRERAAAMFLPYGNDPRFYEDRAYTISEEAAVAELRAVLVKEPSDEDQAVSSPEPLLEPLFQDLIREWD